jgi:hypothetical protein
MSSPSKGGRGKKAPYKTIHYRIPEPIKPTVERFAAAYKIVINQEDSEDEVRTLINSVDDTLVAVLDSSNFSELGALKLQLSEARSQIEKLTLEREKSASILLPALKFPANNASPIKAVIREAFPELPSK